MKLPKLTFNVPLGRWFGIPLILNFWWVAFFVFLMLVSLDRQDLTFAESLKPTGILALKIICVYMCVVLHEYGHALTAKEMGVACRQIMIYPIGGMASIDIVGLEKPKNEFWIVFWGPMVNVALAYVIFCLYMQFKDDHMPVAAETAHIFFRLNVGLVLFNLLPIFPMDGGRLLRAALSWYFKSHVLATKIACTIGIVTSIIAGVLLLEYSHNFMAIVIFAIMAYLSFRECEQVKSMWQTKRQLIVRMINDDFPELSEAERRKLVHMAYRICE